MCRSPRTRTSPLPFSPALRRVGVPLLGVALAVIYLAGRLLPELGTDGHRAVRWWGAITLYAVASALCLVRARRVPGDGRAWTLIGLGIASYALGSVSNALSDRPSDDPPAYALVLWLGIYAGIYPAVLMMLRSRLRPFTLSFCLDGILGGLSPAAVAAVLVRHQVDGIATGKVIAGLALPGADLVLFSILLWACAMSGWRLTTWTWLAAAMAMAAVADVVQDVDI